MYYDPEKNYEIGFSLARGEFFVKEGENYYFVAEVIDSIEEYHRIVEGDRETIRPFSERVEKFYKQLKDL